VKVFSSSAGAVDFVSLQEQLCDWQYTFGAASETPEACLLHDHWLGSSRDGRVWALSVCPPAESSSNHAEDIPKGIVAFLIDPPKRDIGTFASILLRVHVATAEGSADSSAIEEIIRSCPFPEYRNVGSYLAEAPTDWLAWPAALCHDLDLSENTAMSEDTFLGYSRDSLEEALRVVCGGRRWGIALHYSLQVQELFPLLPWEVDWPLSRRGTDEPQKRGRVQGSLPWDMVHDRSLLTIYQAVPWVGTFMSIHTFREPVVRLKVAGKTAEEAIGNWQKCAKALRRLRLKLV
jgi:hypothetical protein